MSYSMERDPGEAEATPKAKQKTVRRSRNPDTFRVEMDCCTSGNCVECNGRGGKLRGNHSTGLTEAEADLICKNWKAYNPKKFPEID